MTKPKVTTSPDLVLLRHQLGSIDLSDIKEEELSESERAEYVAAISAVWPRLEKDLNKFLHDQLMFMSIESEDWNQVLFGRGTCNGLDLLKEHWEKAHNEHRAKGVPKENFDPHNPIGEV